MEKTDEGFYPFGKYVEDFKDVTLDMVKQVYYGRVGCCCGCNGKHSTDLTTIKKKFNFFKRNIDRVQKNNPRDGVFIIESGKKYDSWGKCEGPSHQHIIYLY